MCLVRETKSPRKSKTKEAKEKSQDSRKRSPESRALWRSCKPRTEMPIVFCHSVTGNWGKSSFIERVGEQKTKEVLRREWKMNTQEVSGAGSSSRKSAERVQSWSGVWI